MHQIRRIAASALLCLALSACSGTIAYDVDAAEETIGDAAADAYPDVAPFEVTCDDPPAEAAVGATFNCSATDANGDTYEFSVTGTDDQGNVDIQEL